MLHVFQATAQVWGHAWLTRLRKRGFVCACVHLYVRAAHVCKRVRVRCKQVTYPPNHLAPQAA